MSSIGGPGGVGGPKGPSGPERPDEAAGVDEAAEPAEVARTAQPGALDAIAADIAAGRLTPHEAIERMVDEIAGDQQLDPADRAELRELLGDLVAHDPYLGGLIGRIQ